jgi:hypothetical protein
MHSWFPSHVPSSAVNNPLWHSLHAAMPGCAVGEGAYVDGSSALKRLQRRHRQTTALTGAKDGFASSFPARGSRFTPPIPRASARTAALRLRPRGTVKRCHNRALLKVCVFPTDNRRWGSSFTADSGGRSWRETMRTTDQKQSDRRLGLAKATAWLLRVLFVAPLPAPRLSCS